MNGFGLLTMSNDMSKSPISPFKNKKLMSMVISIGRQSLPK